MLDGSVPDGVLDLDQLVFTDAKGGPPEGPGWRRGVGFHELRHLGVRDRDRTRRERKALFAPWTRTQAHREGSAETGEPPLSWTILGGGERNRTADLFVANEAL